MALELAPKVRVNAVAPGYVLTPMQRAGYTEAMLSEVDQSLRPKGLALSPLGEAGVAPSRALSAIL
jgi:NAD(P)-dependent dehydrogenase (short-subunit alcohol dehydrogenase family)